MKYYTAAISKILFAFGERRDTVSLWIYRRLGCRTHYILTLIALFPASLAGSKSRKPWFQYHLLFSKAEFAGWTLKALNDNDLPYLLSCQSMRRDSNPQCRSGWITVNGAANCSTHR